MAKPPAIDVDDEGSVFQLLPKTSAYGRNMIATVAEMLGGAQGMYDWSQREEKNETAFWTKIMPKLVQPEKDAEAKQETVEEVLRRLDSMTIDVTPQDAHDIDAQEALEDEDG